MVSDDPKAVAAAKKAVRQRIRYNEDSAKVLWWPREKYERAYRAGNS